jgi:hypothetical protein
MVSRALINTFFFDISTQERERRFELVTFILLSAVPANWSKVKNPA